ncbi:unnamed protein product [Symbiodinium sp. CCMP2592]|nr:unnamed protein product [Symbiodinium sp. CCMP2592]
MDATTQRILDLAPTIASDAEISGRLRAFLGTKGGGANKNRRRKATAVELYRGLQRHLHSLESHEASQLLIEVEQRLAVVDTPEFIFTQSVALFPDRPEDYPDIAVPASPSPPADDNALTAAAAVAPILVDDPPAPATPPLDDNALTAAAAVAPILVDDPPAPATPPLDFNASSAAAAPLLIDDSLETPAPRPPASASANLPHTPKPPRSRPRISGIRTPVPPPSRPKHLGIRTPIPPSAGREAPEGGYLVVRPKKRPKPPQDLEGEDLTREFPTIPESFLPRSVDPVVEGSVNSWTTREWEEYNSRQEPSSASVVPATVPQPPTPLPLEVLHTFNDTSEFGRHLQRALQYRAGVRFVLSLDFHKVFDRPDKSTQLWNSLRDVEALQNLPLVHIDDKWDICAEFNRWHLESWKGIHLPWGGRRELADIVSPVIAGWR